MRPRLVAVAHGTRYPEGPRTIELLMRRVKRRLPNVEVSTSYLELAEPSLKEVIGEATSPLVVVPLLLSGRSLGPDLSVAARTTRQPVGLARSLGPHPMLAAAMGMKLRAAGADREDAVVMVALGSNDTTGLVDTHTAGRVLEAHWGAPVKVAHLTGPGRRVSDVMDTMRRQGHKRIALASYLLTAGHYATEVQALGESNEACATSEVLGDHPMVVELVLRRYLSAIRRWSIGSDGFPSRVA